MSTGEDMTRDAGASRTFRTIFGCDVGENVDLTLKRNEHEDEDDDDDWSDDGLAGDAVEHENNNDGEQRIPGSPQLLANIRQSDAAVRHVCCSRFQALNANDHVYVAQHRSRSIEEWADDDEDEDNWKEVLQDRVNQLELVLPLGTQTLRHTVDHVSAVPPGLPIFLLPDEHALITDHTKPQVPSLEAVGCSVFPG